MQRRSFIKNSSLTVISISAFGSIEWNGKGFTGTNPTTSDILGPFYRPGAPFRTNLIPAGNAGIPLTLKGSIFKEDGKTPMANALVEIWHCDEKEVYDNASDEYRFRGAQTTQSDGRYAFRTIVPVPYKASPTDESSWRPAHIHMRVSVPGQQDLITQLYFKGGKYVETDKWASHPQAVDRILPVGKTNSGENEVLFDVVMSKEFPLEKEAYQKITGLYDMGASRTVEFTKNDDLLFMRSNGQLVAALKYVGNNSFEGGIGFPKVKFELQQGGQPKVTVVYETRTYQGTRYLKYSD